MWLHWQSNLETERSEHMFRCYCCDKEITAQEALAVQQRLTDSQCDPKLNEDMKLQLSEMGVHMMGSDEYFGDFKAEYKDYGEGGRELYPTEIRPYTHLDPNAGGNYVVDGWKHGWGIFCNACVDQVLGIVKGGQ